MKYLVLFLCVVGILGAQNWAKKDFQVHKKYAIKGTPKPLSTILGDEPDTIYYDDGIPAWYYNCTDCWGAVRFTAFSDFELRAIYFDLYNITGATDSFYVIVYDTLDGNILAGPYGDTYDAGFWMIQLEIDTVEIPGGSDFYVVEGPEEGMGGNTVAFDNGTTEFRSYVKFSGTDWINETEGDLILRAGGEFSSWADISSKCIFDASHKFFLKTGHEIELEAIIKNEGTVLIPAGSYDVVFSLTDSLGTVYYIGDVAGSVGLPPGAEATILFGLPISLDPGYYIAIDTVHSIYNSNPDNDVSMVELRVYDETVGNWFRYTDYSAEDCYSTIPGNGWATGFLLDCYPATLDSIAIGFGVSPGPFAIDVPIEIWWGMDSPETLLVSGTIDTVFGGIWYSVVPPIEIDSGMIFIAYHYYVDPNENSVCLYQDQTRPIAGRNHCMDVTTFEYCGNPPQWFEDDEGDWFMWAHFSPCLFQPVCGDVNCNGEVGLDDIIYLAHYLFSGGPPPCSYWASDVNCSGNVGMDDLTYLANYLFAGGPPPDCCPSR